MARRRSRRKSPNLTSSRSYKYSGGYSSGYERAKQHIKEAQELTRELGGTDRDVKEYFFSLRGKNLNELLDEYGRRYGQSAKDYAEQTIPAWQTGKRRMSGQVAARLFDLLPPRMPLTEKYRLTENLWRLYGPSSRKYLLVGPDASEEQAQSLMGKHILDCVRHYKIPEQLENRFKWLSAGDVDVRQQLLNHVMDLEKEAVIQNAKGQIQIFITQIRQNADVNQNIHQSVQVGNHRFEIFYDPAASGARLSDTAPVVARSRGRPAAAIGGDVDNVVLWLVGIGIALFIILAMLNG